MNAERLRAQGRAIRALNDQLGGSFRVLWGIEADILGDGSIDLGEDMLRELDWVIKLHPVNAIKAEGGRDLNDRIAIREAVGTLPPSARHARGLEGVVHASRALEQVKSRRQAAHAVDEDGGVDEWSPRQQIPRRHARSRQQAIEHVVEG